MNSLAICKIKTMLLEIFLTRPNYELCTVNKNEENQYIEYK